MREPGLGRSMLPALALGAGVALLAGCEANPSGPEHSDELTVEFSVEPGHVHILQTEVTYTVRVLDHHGEAVTDFVALEVQRLLEGGDTWRGTVLELVGDTYQATYTYSTSGEYQLRVAGQRPGDADLMVLHTAADPLHVVRAHAEAGGYRLEFETFPGHIHEGDEATVSFWILETERNAQGVRPPIGGVSTEMHILEESGASFDYSPVESETGRYDVHHTFAEAGDCDFTIHFTGSDGQEAEATFHHHVVHAH